jgi:hypothetical protein
MVIRLAQLNVIIPPFAASHSDEVTFSLNLLAHILNEQIEFGNTVDVGGFTGTAAPDEENQVMLLFCMGSAYMV